MEPLGVKIRHQRRSLGLTLDDLAARTSISKPYLSLIETGRVPNPPSDEKLHRLEQTLGFPAGELVGQANLHRTPLAVRAMLNQLLQATAEAAPETTGPADDQQLSRLILQQAENGFDRTSSNAIPVINEVTTGYPRDFRDLSYPLSAATAFVGCPDLTYKDAFAARVTGDSMTPHFREGDIVVYSPAAAARHGDDCFIRFDDGQTTFKRVFFESSESGQPLLRLQPRNEKYRSETVAASKVAALYRAVYRYHKLDAAAEYP